MIEYCFSCREKEKTATLDGGLGIKYCDCVINDMDVYPDVMLLPNSLYELIKHYETS